jgi:hypothetical protein
MLAVHDPLGHAIAQVCFLLSFLWIYHMVIKSIARYQNNAPKGRRTKKKKKALHVYVKLKVKTT